MFLAARGLGRAKGRPAISPIWTGTREVDDFCMVQIFNSEISQIAIALRGEFCVRFVYSSDSADVYG